MGRLNLNGGQGVFDLTRRWFQEKGAVRLEEADALPGRSVPMATSSVHVVLGHPLKPPFPLGSKTIYFGMGCFWGAERKFWSMEGVYTTAVGYAGGFTPHPTYEEVCSGQTGHAEVVMVVFDPAVVPLTALLKLFWESHHPAQGMRQGNDLGTQYRSALYTCSPEDGRQAMKSLDLYQRAIIAAGRVEVITREGADAPVFYYAEGYHQQYLAVHPNGYCGLSGLCVSFEAKSLTPDEVNDEMSSK